MSDPLNVNNWSLGYYPVDYRVAARECQKMANRVGVAALVVRQGNWTFWVVPEPCYRDACSRDIYGYRREDMTVLRAEPEEVKG